MRLALIAHDGKKPDTVRFALNHRAALTEFDLLATGTTGGRLEAETGLHVERKSLDRTWRPPDKGGGGRGGL